MFDVDFLFRLFRMRHDVEKNIRVAFDAEVEPPVTCHPRLPAFFVVLLGAERRMTDVLKKKRHLLQECSFDCRRRFGVGTVKVSGGANLH
jgi:hypothetical protein